MHPQERMYLKVRHESESGTLVTVPLAGTERAGSRRRDWFIVGFDGDVGGYYHAFDTRGNSEAVSTARLMRAGSRLPTRIVADLDSVFGYVYASESDIVVALITGTNPAGDEFAIVAHHGDVPEPVALAVLREMIQAYRCAEGLSN